MSTREMSEQAGKTGGEVKFTASRHEARLIREIADRALPMLRRAGDELTTIQDIMMDVEAVHCNGNPLCLQEFAEADRFNFVHDLCGIRRHLDRTTGQLGGCFSPRFSERQS